MLCDLPNQVSDRVGQEDTSDSVALGHLFHNYSNMSCVLTLEPKIEFFLSFENVCLGKETN